MTRALSVGVALVLAALPLTACKEVETESSVSYEPTKLQLVKAKDGGDDDASLVLFTSEAARRAQVQTAPVGRDGTRLVVPYAALLYDEEGNTFVFTSPKPLTFLRAAVEVDRIEGSRALLSEGPPRGTSVATVGAVEVYGAEQEIGGSH
jgi:hypothetical protein